VRDLVTARLGFRSPELTDLVLDLAEQLRGG